MADRLQELLQQRALIKEHLAWLEGEIAAASSRPGESRESPPPRPPSVSFTPAAVPAPITVSRGRMPMDASTMPAPTSVRTPDEADQLLAKLAAEENSQGIPDKKGCWVFFCILLVLSGVGFWVLTQFFYRG
jgi:hypothetical protein